jgi:hypothetical protein
MMSRRYLLSVIVMPILSSSGGDQSAASLWQYDKIVDLSSSA